MSKDIDAFKITVLGRYVGGPIFEAKQSEDKPDETYFSACVVLKDGEEDKIKRVRDLAIKEKYGDKKPKLEDWTLREGDDEDYEHSFGKVFINPKSRKAPALRVRKEGALFNVLADDDLLYPGCYVAISVNAFCYDGDKDKKVKQGVSLQLRALMFVKHGERLTDVVDAEKEFEGFDSEIEEEEIEF